MKFILSALALLAMMVPNNSYSQEKRRGCENRSCRSGNVNSGRSQRDRTTQSQRTRNQGRAQRDRTRATTTTQQRRRQTNTDYSTQNRSTQSQRTRDQGRARRDSGVTYNHTPYRNHANHSRRWNSRDYHQSINSIYIYSNNWLRVTLSFNNGYHYYNQYPYYVYNGYRHRYSNYDTCNYELVDRETNTTERTYYNYSCSTGYDMCANLRDSYNNYEYYNRYFCAERYNYDQYNGDYYEDDYYSDDYY